VKKQNDVKDEHRGRAIAIASDLRLTNEVTGTGSMGDS
jgi:hypothetical protein